MIFDRFPLAGAFRELEYGRPDAPSIREAVRPVAPDHEEDLLRYLRSGHLLYATPSLAPDVLGGPGAFVQGPYLFTDGQWLWFSDLAHYVANHHVAVTPAFVEHARANNWTVPPVDPAHLEAMLDLPPEDETETEHETGEEPT
ncbi:hypothetical protein [Kitasatospora sp. NPDC088134]|uniref:hypothetical protein n=1 Tax=Kitasatospora sp. NPDC088134 TaxID=3364071 RepID=UPI00380D3DA1